MGWVNFFGNVHMQKAILLAQICLYIAVLAPGISDQILGLDGVAIGLQGWGVALLGPLATVILCELAKLITRVQIRNYQKQIQQKILDKETGVQRIQNKTKV